MEKGVITIEKSVVTVEKRVITVEKKKEPWFCEVKFFENRINANKKEPYSRLFRIL